MEPQAQMDPMLSPTPFDRTNKSPVPVLVGGLITGIIALAIVWLMAGFTGFNPMTFYLWFIVPLGALLVGLVAGSGYGAVSWVTGTKISKGLLVAVIGLQVACYFGAMMLEYRQAAAYYDLEGVSFLAYFDMSTRAFAFVGDDGGAGTPLGIWGYAFRLLEIAGFAIGGLIIPLAMKTKPFCDSCQVYMKTKQVTMLPAGIAPRKVKKKDTEGQEAYVGEIEQALNFGMETLKTLLEHAEAGKLDSFREIVEGVAGEQKAIHKLTSRLRVVARVCPNCHHGSLDSELVSGQGENIKTEALSSTPLQPMMVRALIDPGPGLA